MCWVLWWWHRALYRAAEMSDLGGHVLFVLAVFAKTWVLYEAVSAIFERLRSYKIFLSQWSFCLWSLPFCLFTARVQDRVIHPSSIFWVHVCPEPRAVLPEKDSSFKCHMGTTSYHPPSSLPSCCFWSLSWFIWREGCVCLLGGAFSWTPGFHVKTSWSNF